MGLSSTPSPSPAVDLPGLRAALASRCDDPATCLALLEGRPHLFAPAVVRVSAAADEAMRAVIAAVEGVFALPAWREAALARAPEIAHRRPGALGVCFGYDFHLTQGRPQLIEVNTNAGGGVLNAAWRDLLAAGGAETCEEGLAAMFREEWRRERGDRPLHRIAVVDDDPAGQYLYPEFLLFQGLMRRHGIDVLVTDAAALEYHGGALRLGEARIDLVYNRVTDFMLATPHHAALHRAYQEGAVTLTPHPHAHALHADKRHLVALSDPQRLAELGVSAHQAAPLAQGIPAAREVTPDNAEALWRERRRWFFKPATGFGGRGAYRGEKLTRRAWAGLLDTPHIAQAFIPPDPAADHPLKMDLRYYVYAGVPRMLVARLYQGQTTNFRTPSGGFAPVWIDGERE